MRRWRPLAPLALSLVCAGLAAQENYEIQVYGSETVAPGRTMVELHSNFTAAGRKETENGVLPTHHAFHETLEVTHGFTPWFETGVYLFTSIQPGEGWEWVGDHLRPRVRVPEEWEWPVGLSLSTEFGYQERRFSEDTLSLEIRPIIDKEWRSWYFSFNPVLETAFRGEHAGKSFEFSPNAKISYNLVKLVAVGLEYYASMGPIGHMGPLESQEHLLFPALDFNFSPDWELNVGVGFGLTSSTDDVIAKVIVGRRF